MFLHGLIIKCVVFRKKKTPFLHPIVILLFILGHFSHWSVALPGTLECLSVVSGILPLGGSDTNQESYHFSVRKPNTKYAL